MLTPPKKNRVILRKTIVELDETESGMIKKDCNILDIASLGWDPQTIGELDHEKVKAPYIRLISCKKGAKGDTIYLFDWRLSQPNKKILSSELLHSFEHFLLAGFRKHFSESFVCVSPMGCQTGFYLILLNEGRAEKITTGLYEILQEILIEEKVPYAHVTQCGNYQHHDISQAQKLAKELIHFRSNWRDVIE